MTVVLFTLGKTTASAQILFDNGDPVLGTYSYNADSGDPSSLTMAGNIFTAPVTGTAYIINFAGSYKFDTLPSSDHFVVSLSSVSGDAVTGTPDTLITTSNLGNVARTDIGAGSSHEDYAFTAALGTPLTLVSGTNYYLGITDVGDGEDFGFGLTANPLAFTNEQSFYTGVPDINHVAGFNPDHDSLSFSLSVPEPSQWALVLMSGAVLIIVARYRAKASAK